ncbi:GMC oxidoreductase [Devosia sp. A369]
MTIRDLRVGSANLPTSATHCIVGGGVAGLLLASRLAQHHRQVVLLESGGLELDDETHGRMIPISAHDQQRREHLALDEWPLAMGALEHYQRELEDLFKIGHDSFEDIDAAAPGASGLLLADIENFQARWAKRPSIAHGNIMATLGREIRSSLNLTVVLHASVVDFALDRDQGRLQAVSARSLSGATLTVRADEFTIAAGTIESTRLLLALDASSDDRAFARTDALGRYFQDHLKAEIAVVDRQRAELTNHMLGGRFIKGTRRDLHLELSRSAQVADNVSSGFVHVSVDKPDSGLAVVKALAHGLQHGRMEARQVRRALGQIGRASIASYWRLRYRQLYVPRDVPFRIIAGVEQLPDPQNRIRLSHKKDRLGMGMAQLDWKPRDADERTFRSIVRRLALYWKRSGFDTLCPLDWDNSILDPANRICDRAEACAHPSGSTRSGNNPATSVVGSDLRCHAIPNLAVASASVFPTAGSANPSFTVMTLAMWLADSYLGRPATADFFRAGAQNDGSRLAGGSRHSGRNVAD